MSQTDSRKPSADVVALDEARQKRSDASEADLATAGGMLRAAREAMGLSLRDIADRTNIRLDVVEAIEAMEIKKLPSQAYTMGFVRAFAREVDLPEDALMDRFREQAGFTKLVDAPQVKPRPRAGDSMEGGRELSVLALIAIVAFILWCAWSLLVRAEPEADPLATRFDEPSAADVPETAPAAAADEAVIIEEDIPLEARDVPAPEPAAEEASENLAPSSEEDALPSAEDSAEPAATEAEAVAEEITETPVIEEAPAPAVVEPEPAAAPVEEEVIFLRRVEAIDPVYPPLCESDAADTETVRLRYSVNASGRPVSPRVISSSNPCFNGAATTALVRWRYDTSTVTPDNSRGLTTTFTFERPF
ncbi:MAG: helix-turn-helix domain-containing protein [Parvularculaceae bacterium]|nr:helix-turn-helix domain-containing protein [Parvularculaceae bacterium]